MEDEAEKEKKQKKEKGAKAGKGSSSNEQDWFSRVPNELLLHLFSYLPYPTTLYQISRVCKR